MRHRRWAASLFLLSLSTLAAVRVTAQTADAPEASPPAAAADDHDFALSFNPRSLWAEIREGFADRNLLEIVHDIWRAKLFTVGDRAIELSQLVIAGIFLVVGLWLAARLAKSVEKRVAKIKRIQPSVAPIFQKLAFWGFTAIVVLSAMSIAGIPITVFAFFGGALAIGVGFGAQNLFNNLISGLIIMTERPIRIGDIIEVNGDKGRVDDIGNRCTRVRRFDGIDVLVPNSKFLEEPVVNWTLKDADVRGCVSVGVAYGSSVTLTRQLIDQAVSEHEGINKKPAPEVLFTEFGDNALAFEVYFWVTVGRPLDLRRIESDLRYRIEALLDDNRITIAFPQRDVHLDTVRPLEIILKREPRVSDPDPDRQDARTPRRQENQ